MGMNIKDFGARTRRFDGKEYVWYTIKSTKREATQLVKAKKLAQRKLHPNSVFLARIVPYKGSGGKTRYAIFSRIEKVKKSPARIKRELEEYERWEKKNKKEAEYWLKKWGEGGTDIPCPNCWNKDDIEVELENEEMCWRFSTGEDSFWGYKCPRCGSAFVDTGDGWDEI